MSDKFLAGANGGFTGVAKADYQTVSRFHQVYRHVKSNSAVPVNNWYIPEIKGAPDSRLAMKVTCLAHAWRRQVFEIKIISVV
ncbi:hypothetical protein [Enterobacter hormaechei]|uniref:hypothetical protein n=1 Tax=Enterobacter hormaechei TaxID=158836 RepID=UPI0039E60927